MSLRPSLKTIVREIAQGFVGAVRLFLGLFYRPWQALREFLK